MGSTIYTRPVDACAVDARLREAVATLRSAIDAIEQYALEAPHLTRRRLSRLQTTAAIASELATALAVDARHAR